MMLFRKRARAEYARRKAQHGADQVPSEQEGGNAEPKQEGDSHKSYHHAVSSSSNNTAESNRIRQRNQNSKNFNATTEEVDFIHLREPLLDD